MKAAKAALNCEQAHLETRRGTHKQAKEYCAKTDETHLEGPFTFGEEPQQGQRNDLEELGNRVLEGELADEVIIDGGAVGFRNQRALQGLQLIRDRKNMPLWRTMRVLWFWGE